MKRAKMSLANIQGKLSRTEMKNIMAGSGGTCAAYMPTGGASGGPVVTYNISSANCTGLCFMMAWWQMVLCQLFLRKLVRNLN